MSRRCLGGEDLFWPELKADLESNVAFLEELADLFHKGIEPELARSTEQRIEDPLKPAAPLRLTPDPAEAKFLVQPQRQARRYLVTDCSTTFRSLAPSLSRLMRPPGNTDDEDRRGLS